MMTPFLFPQVRVRRRLNPGPFERYQQYKSDLRREFENKCVYCRMPDVLKGYESFGVDHYRPKRHFPLLSTVYSNLFYCCNACNSRKGEYWPTKAERRLGVFIPNPCDHVMFDHMRFKGIKVVEHSLAGRRAIERLELNDEETMSYREYVNDTLAAFSDDLTAAKQTRLGLQEKLRGCQLTSRRLEIERAQQEVSRKIAALEGHLRRLIGQ